MIIESAQDRILRILAVSLGFGSLIFTLLGLASIIDQHALFSPIFDVAVYVIYLGLPLALAALAYRVPARVLRGFLASHAISGLVAIAAWYPVMSANGSLPSQSLPWIMNTIAVATCSAALVLRFTPAIIYVVVIAAAGGLLRNAVSGGTLASPSFQDFVYNILFCGTLTALLQFSLRSGRLQDKASALAQADAAKSGSAETFERNRSRYQEFTSNDVLATFGATLRDGSQIQAATRESARLVLAKMDELLTDHFSPSFLPAPEFVALLKSTIQDAVPLGVAISDQRTLIPVDVADVLASATGAAVRNSMRHATWPNGRPVLRRALVKISPSVVEISITDDGRGFSLARIAPDRMGVRVTILQAVRDLPGGDSEVRTSRGHGTTVTMTWRADGKDAR